MSDTTKSATVKAAWIGAASALAASVIGAIAIIIPSPRPTPTPTPIPSPAPTPALGIQPDPGPNREEEARRKQEEERIRANTIITIRVTFFTTRDDKDDQDVVTAEVWKGGQILKYQSEWAGVKLDNNSTHEMDIPMPPNTQFDNDCELKVRKSGTDGWIFHVQVDGVFGDRRMVQIAPRSGEIHFEDNPNSAASFPLRI